MLQIQDEINISVASMPLSVTLQAAKIRSALAFG